MTKVAASRERVNNLLEIASDYFYLWLNVFSRPRGRGFKPHRRQCVVSLSKTHLSLLSTGSTQEDMSRHN